MVEVTSKQLSLTEWFASINHKDTEALRNEDNSKRERLELLSKMIPIKFDKPVKFLASDFYKETDVVKDYIGKHGDELCAFRLVPFDSNLPKLRVRGKSVKENIPWFIEQNIDFSKYELHIVPHAEPLFSTIFIINNNGIQGEIIRGSHSELTQGYTTSNIMAFYFNFNEWNFSMDEIEMQSHIKNIVSQLKVNIISVQQNIANKLNGEFSNNYLQGYFETTTQANGDVWFIDYNRLLNKNIPIFKNLNNKNEKLFGNIAMPGTVKGFVKIVNDGNISSVDISENNILVCRMTSIDYVPLMAKASGIITDLGGILSHAAIVSRELGKPCLVGVGNATSELKDMDYIELDADSGIIRRLN